MVAENKVLKEESEKLQMENRELRIKLENLKQQHQTLLKLLQINEELDENSDLLDDAFFINGRKYSKEILILLRHANEPSVES